MNTRQDVGWLVLGSVLALATPSDALAAGKGACAGLIRGKGLCQAFCNAQNCDAKSNDTRSCAQLRRAFERQTGSSVFPCEPPVGTNKSGPIDITANGRTVVAANTDADPVPFLEDGGRGLP